MSKLFDYQWRINNLYKIQTKDRGLLPFRRNYFQRILEAHRIKMRKEGRPERNVILKARRLGSTTDACVESIDFALFRTYKNTFLMADKDSNSKKIFRMIKTIYRSVPNMVDTGHGIWKKPDAIRDNVKEIFFKGTNTIIEAGLEFRGDTCNRLIMSEAAHNDHEERCVAVLPSVPKSGDIIIESTANGATGFFHDQFWKAKSGESDFTAFFFGWNQDPDNAIFVDDDFVLDSGERDYMGKFNLTVQQMAWRRQMISMLGQSFVQEYPIIPEEAFLHTGRSVFDRLKIINWPTQKPLRTDRRGDLKIWHEPKKGEKYFVGVDPALGVLVDEGRTDYSVIQVLDKDMNQVAEYRSKIPIYDLHEEVLHVCKMYNNAYVVIEMTGVGVAVISEMRKKYPSNLIHRPRNPTHRNEKVTKEAGWSTNVKTKPLMINALQELIDKEEIFVYSDIAKQEALSYVREDNGSTNAQPGRHDDTVMALALAVQAYIRCPYKVEQNTTYNISL